MEAKDQQHYESNRHTTAIVISEDFRGLHNWKQQQNL
jgi:acid stress-induced BolA-like protein IbaG/YrbA